MLMPAVFLCPCRQLANNSLTGPLPASWSRDTALPALTYLYVAGSLSRLQCALIHAACHASCFATSLRRRWLNGNRLNGWLTNDYAFLTCTCSYSFHGTTLSCAT